jgi:biotin carboxylase
MRTVVYVAPFPMETTLRFGAALASLDDVRLVAVFQKPPPQGSGFDHVVCVPDVFDRAHLIQTLRTIRDSWGLHRVLGILENLQEVLAAARSALDVPGMRPDAAHRFRDKGAMKDAFRSAGLPCARHALVHDAASAWAFAETVGFPLVVKPPDGAGAKATLRVQDRAELSAAMDQIPVRPLLLEEFLVGHEHSFESWVLDGVPCFHSVSRYYPTPLQVTENPHLQWVVHLPRDLSPFRDVAEIAHRALGVLGMDTGMTHMEWFRRTDGSVAIGEVAARPPGARIVKLNALAHDVDMWRVWARLVVDGVFEGPWPRQYSVAAAFLRGVGQGRVVAIEGLERAQATMGTHVVEARLPQVGMPKQGGYEGEGWVIVRHPDDQVVKRAVVDLISTVRVRYA